jgi:hypothetical protein
MPAASVGNENYPHRAVGVQIRNQISPDFRHGVLLAGIVEGTGAAVKQRVAETRIRLSS